ncbi:hypothetical protein ACFL1R_00640 [Candidatus Latescibacterota bacterium]
MIKLEIVLTVSQSKRLIAKGVKKHPVVKSAYNNGTIGICRGTTTSYIAEEFLDFKLEPFIYTTGVTVPKNPHPEIKSSKKEINDIIIHKGEIHMDGETVIEASKNMSPGDVIIKGANALNYDKRTAGCLVGHPAGGTVGGFWGNLYGKKLRLVIPVGLEKEIGFDIGEISDLSMDKNPEHSLMPMRGTIVTEIEAFDILTGAQAFQISAGGIRGAEGSVRLLICCTNEQISRVKNIITEIENETPY